MLLADILGPDLLIVLVVVFLLFGGSQLPKLARSLGSASHEFQKGVQEGSKATQNEQNDSMTSSETKTSSETNKFKESKKL